MYTIEQLRDLSTTYRTEGMSVENALEALARMERENCPLIDEYTGEVIEGEPFVVVSRTSRIVPVGRYCNRYWVFSNQSTETRHYYASQENAYDDGCRCCECCEEWHHPDNMGDDVCIELGYESHWFCTYGCAHECGWETCENCYEWYYNEDGVWTGDYGYCSEECANRDGWHRCERCEEWTYYSRIVHIGYSAETWCESCVDYHALQCDECEEWFDEDEVSYDEDEGRYICEDCGGESHRIDRVVREAAGILHEYGWHPTLVFYTENGAVDPYMLKKPFFYGVELETDGGSNRSGYVNALSGIDGFNKRFWMTRDSSLDNGVEITGHPMTLKAHVGIKDMYEEIGKAANEYGFKSHDGGRCGLHVHVNRDAFGKDKRLQDAAGYKLMRLMQRFEKLFTIFTRRTDNGWCNYKTRRDYKIKDDVVKLNRDGKDERGVLQLANALENWEKTHGQCVNFEHSNTFEIRIFRGTLKWSTYFASLGLVDGLCRTVMNHGSIWVEGVTWLDLMAEVVERCDDEFARECLENYLDEKCLR